MSLSLRVLYQDEFLVVVDKPSGFHVHPPEDPRHRISNAVNCLSILSRQINAYLYPVHRLDRATSGVLIFALKSAVAANLSKQFTDRVPQKTYIAVVRGWLDSGFQTIDSPLKEVNFAGETILRDSVTHFEVIARVELPYPVGRYASSRYSLIRIQPQTGRMHQIRRHFAHLSHPLIGDTIYGDGPHNRFFRDRFGVQQLYLKAFSLRLVHPGIGQFLEFRSRWNHSWHQIFELFGCCPI